MMVRRKFAMPALGALCLSVVVSVSPHQSGTQARSDARAGQHASVTAGSVAGDPDPGWDDQPVDPGAGGGDPGWD